MTLLSPRIPLRFLRGNYGRLALTVIAIACGVALVCAIDLCNRAVLRAFTEVLDTMAGRAALQVTAASEGLFSENVAETAAKIAGVELAVPVVTATAFTTDGTAELLTVHGVEIDKEEAVRIYDARDQGGGLIEDPLVFLNQPDSIVLTRTFARRRNLSVGSQIPLETPTGRQTFTVRGLLEPRGVARAYGGNLLVMDLYAAQRAFTRPGLINRVDLVLDPNAELDWVKNALAAVLPTDLRVEPPAQRKADLYRVMRSMQMAFQATGITALLAAFLIAFNRLSTVFEGRAWTFGVLRAVGLRSRAVWRELLKEALLLGVAGVGLGTAIGLLLGRLLLPVIATAAAMNYNLLATDAKLSPRLSSFIFAALLGFGAAVLAATLPAWRAARVSAAEAIRGRGTEQANVSRHRTWMTAALLAAAVTGTIAAQSATRSATWGLAATGLIAVTTALSARPLLLLLSKPLIAIFSRFSGPTTQFAVAVLTNNPRRTAVTLATLSVGLGSALWLAIVGYSFENSVVHALTDAVRSDLIASSTHVASGFIEAPIDQELVAELKKLPGVTAVAGERVIDWRYGDGPIAIDAFDPAYFEDADFGRWNLVGESLPDIWNVVARGEAAIVSSNFSLNLRSSVGDTVVLDTPSGSLSVQIAGITVAFSSPRGTIIVSRSLFKRFWDDSQVTRVLVRTDPTTSAESVRETIARTLGRHYGLRILSSGELVNHWALEVRRGFAVVPIFAGMVLVVVLLGMADTLAASVADRTRELGAIRAVGVRRRYLRLMLVVEALLLGFLGLILAATLGVGLGTLWVRATFPYLLGWVFDLRFPYFQTAAAAATTIGVCVVAALIPGARAARLDPAVALRYE